MRLTRAGAGAYPAQRAHGHPDDRRARADNRQARAPIHALHPARTRAAPADRQAQACSTRSAVAENLRRSRRFSIPDVVKTFPGPSVINQSLRGFTPFQSAKLG